MKRLIHIAVALLLVFAGCPQIFAQGVQQEQTEDLMTISGVVKDRETGRPVANANVILKGTPIGTVTNADGLFSLKIPAQASPRIEISHLGYSNMDFVAPMSGIRLNIELSRTSSLLTESIIYDGDPKDILHEALRLIPANYPTTNDMLSAFYRETIRKGRRYTEVAEAVVDIEKTSYHRRRTNFDKVQVRKGRTLISSRASDTLAVHVEGGPTIPIVLDFVKNEDFLFNILDLDNYKFTMSRSDFDNNRYQFVIAFEPAVTLDYPLFKGLAYIDAETLAFTRAEFEIDMSDRDKVTKSILRRRPAGLVFVPQKVYFTITYRQDNGKYFLSYIKNEFRFKCDWKKRHFASAYTAVSEMVVVDREEATESTISRKESFNFRQAFAEVVNQYWDEDFWKDYNIIEPTESLERAVGRLKKGHEN